MPRVAPLSFVVFRVISWIAHAGKCRLPTLIRNCTFLNCRNLNSSRQVRGSTSPSPQARFVLNYAQLEDLPSSGGSPTLNEWDDCLEAGYRPPNPKMAKLQWQPYGLPGASPVGTVQILPSSYERRHRSTKSHETARKTDNSHAGRGAFNREAVM